MSSGNQISSKIDSAVRQVESAAAEVTRRLDDSRSLQARLRRRISDYFHAIARVQGEALDSDEIKGYDAETIQLDEGMVQRHLEGASLAARVRRTAADLESVQDQEATVAREMDAATDELRGITLQTDARLKANAEHQSLLQAAAAAAERHDHAVSRSRSAARERAQKQVSYEQDVLFMYLHRYGYGTEKYRAWSLVRTIDGWVAKLCNFLEEARNYQALLALPRYLEERAERLQASREEAEKLVTEARRRELEVSGAAPIEGRIEGLNQSLVRISARREIVEMAANQAQAAWRQFSAWEDQLATSLLDQMQRTLATESLSKLAERVARTRSDADDQALAGLQAALAELKEVDAGIEVRQKAAREAAKRVEEIRDVRSRYRSKGYNSSDYRFGSSIDRELQSFVEGMLTGAVLWSSFTKQAEYDPPRSSGTSSSGAGSFGGGGFTSDGGFGGGGFSTGGGF